MTPMDYMKQAIIQALEQQASVWGYDPSAVDPGYFPAYQALITYYQSIASFCGELSAGATTFWTFFGMVCP